jgi:hypothetical protein
MFKRAVGATLAYSEQLKRPDAVIARMIRSLPWQRGANKKKPPDKEAWHLQFLALDLGKKPNRQIC